MANIIKKNINDNVNKPPSIKINYCKLEKISEDSFKALVRANDPPRIFVMGGRLIRLRSNENSRPIIDEVDVNILSYELERAATFKKRSNNMDVPTAPPTQILKDILSMVEWPGIPVLQGVIQAPVPNGEILDKPGYDQVTKLYYLPSPDLKLPTIPVQPNDGDINKAKNFLREVIINFPFATEADFSNMLALLLTPLVRPAIEGPVPMAVISAPQKGSGKTLLGEICGIIATGHNPHMLQYSQSEEETRKKITAALRQGEPVIEFDNVRCIVDSGALASVLTSTEWSDRLLGRSENVRFPQKATWIANGNNLRIGDEFIRRCYPINLVPENSQPWRLDDFLHSPLTPWVRKNRGDLIWSILVLVRYWTCSGKPRFEEIALGNFTEWVAVIGGILINAGYTHFLGNIDNMYAEQAEEEDQWMLFLSFLSDLFGDGWFTTDELCKKIQENPSHGDYLPDEIAVLWIENEESKNAQKRQIGRILKGIATRKFGESGIYLETSKDKHRKVTKWKVICGVAG